MATGSASTGKPSKNKLGKESQDKSNGLAKLAQALIRSAGTGIYIVQDGKFRYVNSLFQDLTGYEEKELFAIHSLDLVHPEDRETVRKKAIESLKGQGSPIPCEYRFVKKDGKIIWVLERVTSTEYEGKRATVGSFMDITERKRAEEAMRESEQRYRLLAENAQDMIFQMQLWPERKFKYMSPSATFITGYTPEERYTDPSFIIKLIHPEDRAVAEAFQEKPESLAQPVTMRWIRKDGAVIWVESLSTFTYDNEGRPVSVIGVVRDVTERKRIEESLQKNERRLREAQELGKLANWEYDLATKKIDWSDGVYKLFERDRALGPPTPEEELHYYTPEEAKRLRELNRAVIKEEKELAVDSTANLPSGKTIFLNAWIRPVKDENGRVIKLFGTIQDITERKQLEQKLTDMATSDTLTGLPNRVLLHDRIAVALAQAQRDDARLAIMMLDLDKFKDVNDTLGHDVGDQLLRAVGERLVSLVRKSDTVARVGGDEFVVFLPEVAKTEDATKVAQKVLEAFRKPFVLDGHQIHTTTSIGIALYPEDGGDAETLLKNADTAMYWVKEQGRDNYELYWHNGTKTL